tara:strand:- start:222 stop:491 length:270 start_codon:yes stop_codon:yes gene_type:complete
MSKGFYKKQIDNSVDRTNRRIKNTLKMERELDKVKDLLVKMIESEQYSGFDDNYFKSIIDEFTNMRINRIRLNKIRMKTVDKLSRSAKA